VHITPIADSIKLQLDTIVKLLATTNNCRFTIKIANDSGAAYYSGYDGRDKKPITDFTGTIEIGSCTKMFTATSILQLVEQNKFSLQDRLTTVLKNDTLYKNLLVINGKDYIDSVKIIHLLNHSTGFPEYFIDGDDDKEIAMHGDSTLRFTPYELISIAKKQKTKQFIPGNTFKYCNVNYLLLGLIIEKYSGKPFQQYMQEHIIDPLGLKHTYFGSVNPPAKRMPGFYKSKMVVMPATLAGAAGEIISDLDDMQTFIRAWGKGKLFTNPATTEQVKKENFLDMSPPVLYYGMGTVNILDLSLGHGGQTFGYQSFMGILNNQYSFVFGIDDAAVSGWNPAIQISSLLSAAK
jgi:D-alanyl-D-alanine carboxypeptidase